MSSISIQSAATLDSGRRYDLVQRILHWAMAAVILAAIAIGLYCEFQEPGTPVRRFLLEIHKSLGSTAFFLLILRFAYRLLKGAPPYREALSPATHAAASLVHWGLYAMMLYMPVTGYVHSAAGGNTLPWFWLFQWPRLVALDKPLGAYTGYLHDTGAYVIYVLLALHFAAVIWHRFVKRDGILARML